MSIFQDQLKGYQHIVNNDIAQYAAHIQKSAIAQYGSSGEVLVRLFLEYVHKDTERIPGTLAITAYEMLGGKDREMIVRAATALEMMHAYVLIMEAVDRRNEKSYIQAAMIGMHAAQMLFAGLSVAADLKVKVLGIVNLAMVVTGYGQAAVPAKKSDPIQIAEWKAANHLTLNPLCVGMVLAGADCHDTDAIRDYALDLGIAMTLTDQASRYSKQAVQALSLAPPHWHQKQRTFLASLASSINPQS